MMADTIQTIEDLEKVFYSQRGQAFLNSGDLSTFISKTDAPVLSSTTGVYNAVYGVQAWSQLNQEANTFGILPKVPYGRTGMRVLTARGNTRPYGGVGEDGTIPELIKPTFAEVSFLPKTMASVFGNTEVQEFLATSGKDDSTASMNDLRGYFMVEHKEDINAALNTQNGTLASNNYESIDRIIGSYAELNADKENDQSTGYAAGDLDPYGASSGDLDRDGGAGWTDAYVGLAATPGTVESITDSKLQALLQNTLANGADPKGQVIQTGYDSWSAINQLYDPQVRYNLIGQKNFSGSVNGIKTMEGQGFGTTTATLFDRPVILSKDTVKDTGGISRVYMMDIGNPEGHEIPRLCLKVAKPTQYFEAGMNNGTPFAIDKLRTEGMLRTVGELSCRFYKVQGKLRDLKA